MFVFMHVRHKHTQWEGDDVFAVGQATAVERKKEGVRVVLVGEKCYVLELHTSKHE